jgi:hypothetical protein
VATHSDKQEDAERAELVRISAEAAINTGIRILTKLNWPQDPRIESVDDISNRYCVSHPVIGHRGSIQDRNHHLGLDVHRDSVTIAVLPEAGAAERGFAATTHKWQIVSPSQSPCSVRTDLSLTPPARARDPQPSPRLLCRRRRGPCGARSAT